MYAEDLALPCKSYIQFVCSTTFCLALCPTLLHVPLFTS